MRSFIASGLCVLVSYCAIQVAAAEKHYDVVVYGGTSGGVVAAVQARRLGHTALLIEPGQHLGGLTSGGLGATDIGNKGAIGGISREFYKRVKSHYEKSESWVHERREDYKNPRFSAEDDAMWTFEPHVAEAIYRQMISGAGVDVLYGEQLLRPGGVSKSGARITAIAMESGKRVMGSYFIDATYEGDLFAAANVSYHVGREANSVYDETLNGVQTKYAIYHQMVPKVDPYRVPGDESSGLLPGVVAGPLPADGTGDSKVQAYNFRMCLTDDPDNRVPFEKPEGYDPLRYELLLRNFEAGERRIPWAPTLMPNRKTDVNNNYGFSTDNIGMNYEWPEGDYATRERIFADHLLYQRGLMWTLANDPRVPQEIRAEVSRWGNCKDEFPEHGGWSHQLYVREGRRMISEYVMTQHNCEGRIKAEDSVGLAAYTMDSHHIQRYVDSDGFARNEGDVQVGGFPPYPISYRAIRPKREECENLLVPVSLSSSHIAFGSIRMEPVFMVLGQSAATAASIALDGNEAVQDVEYATLRKRLEADGQILDWTGPAKTTRYRIDAADLAGIVIDDLEAELSHGWLTSSSVPSFVGNWYRHDANELKGKLEARFKPKALAAGTYEVRVSHAPHENRATNVPVTITHARGKTTVTVNQRQKPTKDGAFVPVGIFTFEKDVAEVMMSNAGTDGHMVVDAVQFIPMQNETKN
ncbi:MAG TPA: FAD-dependent oxidoreductase [Candidatus Hydrogenedentes bacterium]|nr:FAD-dependent oxidoreductase [Candidatus Hydrogenedentota bacterium]